MLLKNILVITKENETNRLLHNCFSGQTKVDKTFNHDMAMSKFREKRYDLIFYDIRLLNEVAQKDGYKAVFQCFWQSSPSVEIFIMTYPEMIRDAVMAVKAGASNYITYPINPDEVKLITENMYETIKMESELNYLRNKFWQEDSIETIRTNSPIMKKVFEKVRSVAPTKSTVLISGETGTGKGVIAKLIHHNSNRNNCPFISVHCGAIPDTLIESELFGHEKGAFTGAIKRKLGKFEIANTGTIFLDEVGTITQSAQIKLLQILQEGSLNRVGGEEQIETNVRVIAATNSDLKQMCDNNEFRKDLYYRLNVFPIEIPPLRDRLEDVSSFVDIFLKRMNKFHSKEIRDVHPQVMASLKRYHWPGNIRELENLIERAYILENSPTLTPESFPAELFEAKDSLSSLQVDPSLPLIDVRRKGIEEIERSYIKEVLFINKGKIKESAMNAGITTRQLNKLMNKYNIHKEDFKPKK